MDPIEFQLVMPNEDVVVFRITGHSSVDTALLALELAGTDETLQTLKENL